MLATLIPANAGPVHTAKSKTRELVKLSGLVVDFKVGNTPSVTRKAIEIAEIPFDISPIQASVLQ